MNAIMFDFDGALRLARQLHALGRSIDALIDRWGGAGERAVSSWRGPYGDEFATMVERAVHEGRQAAVDLRAEADRWAVAWADAMNEQNRRNLDDYLDRQRNDRSWADRMAGSIGLGDEVIGVPRQPTITPPVAPHYQPTGRLHTY